MITIDFEDYKIFVDSLRVQGVVPTWFEDALTQFDLSVASSITERQNRVNAILDTKAQTDADIGNNIHSRVTASYAAYLEAEQKLQEANMQLVSKKSQAEVVFASTLVTIVNSRLDSTLQAEKEAISLALAEVTTALVEKYRTIDLVLNSPSPESDTADIAANTSLSLSLEHFKASNRDLYDQSLKVGAFDPLVFDETSVSDSFESLMTETDRLINLPLKGTYE